MRCVARTHFVNRSPEGDDQSQPLSMRQIYDALKIKARDPREFVEVIEECTVIKESETELLRAVKFKGNPDRVQERVEFFEPTTANFTMLSSEGEVVGRIANIISTTPEGEVLLTFTFAIGRIGHQADAAGEEHANMIVSGADKAIAQTIKTARKLVKEGKV